MAQPTAILVRWMLTCQQMLSVDACFVFVESTEYDTIPFLLQGESQITLLSTAEPGDSSGMPGKDTRYTARMFHKSQKSFLNENAHVGMEPSKTNQTRWE